jgi:peptidoglycan/xylan/chitin deacetylase (PgdA/CDA1 family)
MHQRLPLPVISILFIGILILTGCHFPQAGPEPTPTDVIRTATVPLPTHTIETVPPTETPTATVTPTFTPPPPTHTPSLTPTPTWVYNEPGQVIAPILLYHHVNGEISYSRYNVAIPDFRAQMQALYDHGYTGITLTTLLDALLNGGELPAKPIVITFDDGHQSVYDNAFPIMQEYGFPGVFYIVANRINDIPDFVNIEEITTLVDAGWEIGSHGYTHLDMTKNHASVAYEIDQSKYDLQSELGVPVNTFAYPYGEVDPFVASKVSQAGYLGAVGLGRSITHTWNSIFYLSRIEVYSSYTLDTFLAMLNPQ